MRNIISIIYALSILPATSLAEVYKCNVDGKVVYSESKCAENAKAVPIDPVPIDSLNHIETYEQQLIKQQAKQAELERWQRAYQEAQRKAEQERIDKIRHDQAVEEKLEEISRNVERARDAANSRRVCRTFGDGYGGGTTICR